jgi:hypothetical protein
VPLTAEEVIAMVERDLQLEAPRELIRTDELSLPSGPFLTTRSAVSEETEPEVAGGVQSQNRSATYHESTQHGATEARAVTAISPRQKPTRPTVALIGSEELLGEAPLPGEGIRRPVDLRPRKAPLSANRRGADSSAVDPSEAEEAPLPAE